MSNQSFTDWFNAQGIRHFSAAEFTRYFAAQRNGVKNSQPAQATWKRILHTLRVVDELRASFDKPCRILSSYRSPAYNKAVGGAPLSLHLGFNALDIAFDGVSPQQVYDRLIEWRKAGKFTGGLGLYQASGFVHIDTRGNNATWQGN
jgi:uncharacterized protein YcbK (DUF882 family)